MDNETASAVVDEVLPDLATMSEEDRTKFIETGEFPQKAAEGDGQPDATSGAASAAADNGQEPANDEPTVGKSRFQRRIDKQTARIKDLEAQLSQMSAQPRGAERPAEAATDQSLTAPSLKSFTDQIGINPKYPDYDTAHEAWERTIHAFYGDQTRRAVAEVLKQERAALDKATAENTAKRTIQENAKEFAKRAAEYRKTLKQDRFIEHFTEVKKAIDEAMAERPEMGELSDLLIEIEAGPALIQYLGEHPDELDAILELPVARALHEIGKLEVSDKIKAPPPKTTTAAKRIGSQVHGSAAATVTDEEVAAVESNKIEDFLKAKKINVSW